MSTEAPVAPVAKSGMSDEHKRKMAEGRARRKAEDAAKKAGADLVLAELQRMRAEIEALKAPKPDLVAAPAEFTRSFGGDMAPPTPHAVGQGSEVKVTSNLPAVTDPAIAAELARLHADNDRLRKLAGLLTPAEIATLPTEDVCFEFVADRKTERDEPIGEVLRALDDPRWEELFKIRHAVYGQVIVRAIIRAKSGEEIRREDRTCINARTPRRALDMMRARTLNPTGNWYE